MEPYRQSGKIDTGKKMGWWRIKNIETGRLDLKKIKKLETPEEYNEEMLLNGDEPADILTKARKQVDESFRQNFGRTAKREELIAAWNFVLGSKKEDEQGEGR